MDVYSTIEQSLRAWDKDGQTTCRAVLSSPLCSLSDPSALECVDVVSTVYQTLLHATLASWPVEYKITVPSLVSFTQAVLNDLPSSSSALKSKNLIKFGELLVDVVWAVDSELEEILADVKTLATTTASDTVGEARSLPSKEELEASAKVKTVAESDKEALASFITKLLICGIVEPSKCRERLDGALLSMTRLIPDKILFEKKEIRTKTALFYKQNKFNLLREQSEGYTKLTTDLISSLGSSHDTSTGLPSETFDAVETRAQAVWERVLTFIGCFDLDPNRALDIILDLFSVNIASHWQFFLSLLSYSPWAGGSVGFKHIKPEVGDRDSMDTEAPSPYRGKELDEILKMVEGETTQATRGREVNRIMGKDTHVLAQVLGFKFGYYQLPDVFEVCPKGLYMTAALLIRQNFVSLEEIYPHLGPPDEDMKRFPQKYLEKLQARVNASAMNALAMSAPLESGPSAPSRPRAATNVAVPGEQEKPVPTKEDQDQKGMLCIALLSVGAFRSAFAIISKFPWMVDVYPEIADLIIRVLKVSIEPLYQAVQGTKERNLGFLQPRPRYAQSGLQKPQPRKTVLTLVAPTPPGTHVVDYVFFFPHWAERVPICRTRDDLEDVIEPMVRLISFYISREPLFITKLARVGKAHLAATVKQDEETKKQLPIMELENPIQAFWYHMLRKFLLPALSMIPGNAVCTVEVWNILKQYETTVRWQLYGEWRDVTYKSNPELKAQQALREREAKGILRRLSSQTVDSLSGTVAKMAHSNPCIFFTNAVSQIQAYENLADVVIQALRHSTNMGFDILVFITLDAMANPNKERVKEDGVYTSDWLQNLATFVGSLYKRYNSDLTPLLKYIVHQLYNRQTTEIIVLEKLVLKMAGIEPLPTLSDSQIIAMAGGPTLRVEAVASELRGAGFDVADAHLKGAPRLGRALIDSGLAFPLLVQVEQQRQSCIYVTQNAHLKSMAYLFDSTHGVLFQYLDLLMTPTAVSFDDYCKILPPITELVGLYGVSVPVAMHIIRPILNNAVLKHAKQWKTSIEAAKAKSAEDAEKRLKAALAAKREPSAAATPVAENSTATEENDSSKDAPAVTEAMDVDTSIEKEEKSEGPWLPELHDLFDKIKEFAPGNSYEIIGPALYATFWQMSSYDIYLPKDKYIETEKSLDNNARAANKKYGDADRSSDRSVRATAVNHRNQRDRYQNAVTELRKERAVQELVHKFTTDKGGRLDKEKRQWLSHVGQETHVKIPVFVQAFVEHCVLPRCLLSPMDADYCVRLAKSLHEWGTSGWHTLMFYDRVLNDSVKNIVFSCSENEARNFGRFLKGVLHDLYIWYKDEKAFDASTRREVDGKTVYLPGLSKPFVRDGPATADGLLKWNEFKSFLRKCHRRIGSSFTECIQAGDFMHVYNAILVLKEILEVFPIAAVNEVVGSSIDFEISKLINSEERGDLKILARAYSAGLKKREEFWISPKTKASAPPKTAPSNTTPRAPGADRHAEATSSTKGGKPPTAPASDSIPSGPRGAQNTTLSDKNSQSSASTKLALDSIPKPEVVKRVRPEVRAGEKQTPGSSQTPEPMQVDKPTTDYQSMSTRTADGPAPLQGISAPAKMDVVNNLRKEAQQSMNTSRSGSPNLTNSPRTHPQTQRTNDEHVQRSDSTHSMPPPSAPAHSSSTLNVRANTQQPTNPSAASNVDLRVPLSDSSHLRSSSPASRPGTRNHSADSRMSGDRRSRSERDGDREEDSRRAPADSTSRAERSERLERSGGAHRDVLHGRSERNGRERIPGSSLRDAERDRDRERDSDRGERRGEKEKDRDRERDRDRDRDRRRDREPSHRERDREREKETDRHRRDEREREREQRRDAKGTNPAQREADTQADHGATRSDSGRHRSGHGGTDDSLGKRRRAAEDEPTERSSKRNSRRLDHREDRPRRTSEKEGTREHARESDRRRKERDGPELETKSLTVDKPTDRSSRQGESLISPASNKSGGPPPSAPRAMSTTSPRTTGRHELPPPPVTTQRERERERERNERNDDRMDRPDRADRSDRDHKSNREDGGGGQLRGNGNTAGAVNGSTMSGLAQTDGSNSTSSNSALPTSNSLRSRISDLSSSGSRAYAPRNQDELGDARKRTVTERDRDTHLDTSLSSGSALPSSPGGASAGMKRPRTNRPRYQDGPSLAQRVLTSTGHAPGRGQGGGSGGSGK